MANLVLRYPAPLSKITANPIEAAIMAGFTTYLVGCVYLFDKEDDSISKNELVAEVVRAGYICWKWKMGLGPPPTVNTGLPNE